MTISDWLDEISVKFDELGFVPTTLTDEKSEHFIEWFATEISEIKKEEERLKAKLKAQLKNAVELPCRVGGRIYAIRENGVQELEVKSIELVDYGSANKYFVRCSRVAKDDFIYLADNVYGVCWFTDRAEAEVMLCGNKRGRKKC